MLISQRGRGHVTATAEGERRTARAVPVAPTPGVRWADCGRRVRRRTDLKHRIEVLQIHSYNNLHYVVERGEQMRDRMYGGTYQGHPTPTQTAGDLAIPRVISKGDISALFRELANRRKHGICSVVGNANAMRNGKQGQKIDAADAVYRMNFAPVKGFQDFIGSRTDVECLNPEKFRANLKRNPRWATDVGDRPQVLVVGDTLGSDATDNSAKGPCLEMSPGGSCVKRLDVDNVRGMDQAIQRLTEELLATVQQGVGEEDGVPTTGLYCLVLAMLECEKVDVYGVGAGTIQQKDLNDLEYFKDQDFRGWDARHNAEAERTLLRVLASRVWHTDLSSMFGTLLWHNPLSTQIRNTRLIDNRPCTSGIRC